MTNKIPKNYLLSIFAVILGVCLGLYGCNNSSEIVIGVIAELTGDTAAAAQACRNAAEMAVREINSEGGIEVAGKRYRLRLIVEDSAGSPEKAAAAARKLITEDRVLAIIGPNISSNAIPAADVAEELKTVLIAPWSTNVKTTLNAQTGAPKKYVFRTAFIDPWQGRIDAKFAIEKMNAKKAAVLYDSTSDYNRGLAEAFKAAFQENGGRIVAFESYKKDSRDFSAQLARIKRAEPNIVFLPNYYHEIPLQIKQAHSLGLRVPFFGGDACGSQELLAMCGADCEGFVFSTHYTPASGSQTGRRFNNAYKESFRKTPDDLAALTYDSFGLLKTALAGASRVDRDAVRDGISKISRYEGVTGTMQFKEGSGDPIKSAVIVQIKGGRFIWYADALP